jgi:hypothetical protein
MSNQGKRMSKIMIPQKLHIIRHLESDKSWKEAMISYNYLWYKEREGPITIIYGTKW